MSMKPRPVKVSVKTVWMPNEYEVVFTFAGKKFRTDRVFFRKESAERLAENLQAVFDKAQA